MQKVLQDFLVGNVGKCHFVQRIVLHELVKDVGTQHHGLGYLHRRILELIKVGATLDDVIEECQTSTFSTQGTFTNAGKLAITVEAVTMEDGNDSLVLHLSITDNGIENILTMCIHICFHLPRNLFQELCHRENGTRC